MAWITNMCFTNQTPDQKCKTKSHKFSMIIKIDMSPEEEEQKEHLQMQLKLKYN